MRVHRSTRLTIDGLAGPRRAQPRRSQCRTSRSASKPSGVMRSRWTRANSDGDKVRGCAAKSVPETEIAAGDLIIGHWDAPARVVNRSTVTTTTGRQPLLVLARHRCRAMDASPAARSPPGSSRTNEPTARNNVSANRKKERSAELARSLVMGPARVFTPGPMPNSIARRIREATRLLA